MFTWKLEETPMTQLGADFYDPVQSADFSQAINRYINPSVPVEVRAENFAHFKPLPNNLTSPLALRYHGHQFQHYNPDLGDGRGFLYAQIFHNNQWYDLGTKGSGQTPYSRAGDGRLTLKGAYRESLATEQLTSLGVNTSQTLCFFETGENLVRHDEPSPTRSAVLTRFTQGHIRIGTFQRLAFVDQVENIKKLTSYCLFFYYPEVYKKLDLENETLVAQEFLLNVTERSAKLVAQIMMAGFVHGVLNTDNINISGELFDYGPYRFLPKYDPEFTAAYFDQNGLYCFGRQPASFLWALQQLAGSLQKAYPQLQFDNLAEIFSQSFNEHLQFYFLKRLNLKPVSSDKTLQLLSYFFQLAQKSQVPFEQMFFDFHSKRALSSVAKTDFYSQHVPDFLALLEEFETDDKLLAGHPYFEQAKPCTLLIDEIESIWSFIEKSDDWSFYYEKLQQIRSFRGIY